MGNFGYLGVLSTFISSLFSSPKSNGYARSRIYRNLVKFFSSLIFLIVFGFALMKVYEVPVYYTKVDIMADHCTPVDSCKLNIRIIRDYDRADKRSEQPDSITDRHSSTGIFISGIFKPAPDTMDECRRLTAAVRQKLDNTYKQYNRPPIDDPQVVYLSVQASYRQKFAVPRYRLKESKESHQNYFVHRTFFDGEHNWKFDYETSDYFYYSRLNTIPGDNGCVMEDFYAAARSDSLLYITSQFSNTSHRKPSVLDTAEDVSKLVEVIDLCSTLRGNDEHTGAWAVTKSLKIDYVGPAEFSSVIKPEPDEMTLNSIRYTDPAKIAEIGKNGLRYHVKFPDMENIQEARIFILSGLVTGIAALCFKYLYRLLSDLFRYFRHRCLSQYRLKRKHYLCMAILAAILIYYVYRIVCDTYVDSFDLG